MNLNLKNKVALVTGGGRDIGKLISLNLAAEKVSVAVNYNSSPKEAEETVSTIKKLGGTAKAYKGDISNYDETIYSLVGRCCYSSWRPLASTQSAGNHSLVVSCLSTT